MREENGVLAHELKLERNLNETVIARKDSELTSLSMALQQKIEENSILKNELKKIGGGIDKNTITILQTELEKVRGELMEKETAIATLQTELDQAKADLGAETLKLEDKINNYRINLLNKDEEIREKEKTISELENLIVSAAKNDESVSKVEEPTTPPGEQPTDNPEPEKTEAQTTEEPPTVDDSDLTEIVDAVGLIEYLRREFPDSDVEYKKIKDSIRDKHKKARGEEISRLACFERDYSFKYIGKNGNDHQYEIPKKS